MTDNNIKILVVGDSATLRMSLKNVLEQLGYSEIDEAEKGKIVESIKAGLDAYITKPFSISTLQQKIENIFNPKQ